VSILGPALLQFSATGEEPRRIGNRSERASPHNVYPCAGNDRWCAIAVSSESEWTALCAALGRSAWANDPRFASMDGRRANEDALDALIAAETITRRAEDLAERLQRAGVPAAPVNHLGDLLADPWYREQYFSEHEGPEGCMFTAHGEPIRPFGRKQPVARSPMLGEHTDDVLRDVLGITGDEIDRLYACGVLG
jgi:benzylsuccinate CoA-transferase BbsF subunit